MPNINQYYREIKEFHWVTGLFLLVFFCLAPGIVHAKETGPGLDETALKSLARDFVSRIGGKLKTYDEGVLREKRLENPLEQISDGELLLLRPKSGKFIMDADISAVKHNDVLYYSLPEILSVLEMSVDYDPEKKTGSGWFLREDWLIRFDFIKGEVVSRGKDYKVGPSETYEDFGTLYISAEAARKWLAMETKPDVAQQYLDITTPYPFPALARNYRSKNLDGRNQANVPVLPRLETENKMLDINTLETQESIRLTKTKDKKSNTTHQNVTSIEGDLLKHNLYATSFYDGEEKLTSVRARLTKDSERPELLGPLKARYYAMGDVDTTTIPLAGTTTQELGFRVNNNPLRNADFQTTTISGDSLPGWDVELYRDGGLVDRIRVDDDARYEFRDIQLYAGENLFEVFFYGPQGEIRSDKFDIPVNEEFLATQDGTYDVSVSLNEAQLYSKFPSETEDANTPNVAARYNKYIGDTLTYAGIRTTQLDGNQKAYIAGGFTHIWDGFILDGNLAADEKASKAAELSIRKNIDDWRLFLGANARDDDYESEGDLGKIYGVNMSANKNFMTPFDTRTTLTTTAEYDELVNDGTYTRAGFSISNQRGRFNLTNTTTYQKYTFEDEAFSIEPSIDQSISGRYSIGRFYIRAGLDYNIKPKQEIQKYFSQFSYQPQNYLTTDLLLEHDPGARFTEARLNVNYKHEKFRITPFASIDTNEKFQTGLRITTSLVDDPSKAMPVITSDRVMGRGLVSSFVYHDKNGNNLFDGNDEPLPEVIVESVNVTRRVKTDEKGYSLIRDLPENFLTDIRIDKSSLPDPFMIPGFDGVSILPRAGQMVELSFPVHMAGEIDGTVIVEQNNQNLVGSQMTVELYPVDGKVKDIQTAQSAFDGYYVLSNIKPGSYLLSIDASDARKQKAGGIAPIPVKIGYDGTVLSGQDLKLHKGRVQVPMKMETYKDANARGTFFALDTKDGGERSKLAVLLEKMIVSKTDRNAKEGLVPIALEGHENLKVLPNEDWNAHYNRCQLLNDEHIPCQIILFVPEKNKQGTLTAQR